MRLRIRYALALVIALMVTGALGIQASSMSAAQFATLKADIDADQTLSAFPHNSDGSVGLAALYNLAASPDYWVWRTSVSREDIYNTVDFEGNSWSWTTYKGQSLVEQNAWVQMFMGDRANFAAPNLRAGVVAIFSGSAPANAQQAHCLSVGRRKATRFEKLFAVGAGSTAAPSVMALESPVSYQDIDQARGNP